MALKQLQDSLSEARTIAERDSADKAFLSKSIGGLEHTQRQLTALLQAANERALHAEGDLRSAAEQVRQLQSLASNREQDALRMESERNVATQRADALAERIIAAELQISQATQEAARADAHRRAVESNALEQQERLDENELELSELRQAARAASQAAARLEKECSTAQAAARGLAERLQESAAALDREREAQSAAEQHSKKKTELDLAALQIQLQEAGEALAALTIESTHLEGAAGEASARAAAAEERVAATEAAIGSLQQRLRAAADELATARALAEARREELELRVADRGLQEQIERQLRVRADELSRQLSDHVQQLQELQHQLSSVRDHATADSHRWQARMEAAEGIASTTEANLRLELESVRIECAQLRQNAVIARERAEADTAALEAKLNDAFTRAIASEAALTASRKELDSARAGAAAADLAVGELRQQLMLFRAQLADSDAQSASGLSATSGALQIANDSRAMLLSRLSAATELAIEIKQLRDVAIADLRRSEESRIDCETRCAMALADLEAARTEASQSVSASRKVERELRASLNEALLASQAATFELESAHKTEAALRARLEDAQREAAIATVECLEASSKRRPPAARILVPASTQCNIVRDVDAVPDDDATRLRLDLEREVRSAQLLREELEGAWANVEAMRKKQTQANEEAASSLALRVAAESALRIEAEQLRGALGDAENTITGLRGRIRSAEAVIAELNASALQADATHRGKIAQVQHKLEDAWDNIETLHNRLTAAPTALARTADAGSQTFSPLRLHVATSTFDSDFESDIVLTLRRQLFDAEARAQSALMQQQRLDQQEAEAVRSIREALAAASKDVQCIELECHSSLEGLRAALTAQSAEHEETEAQLEEKLEALRRDSDVLRQQLSRDQAASELLRSQHGELQSKFSSLVQLQARTEVQRDEAQRAQRAAEICAGELQSRASALALKAGDLQSELAVTEAILGAQRDELARSASVATLAEQRVVNLEGRLAAALADFAERAADDARRPTSRDFGVSCVPHSHDMGCSAAPVLKDASTEVTLELSSSGEVSSGVASEVISSKENAPSHQAEDLSIGLSSSPFKDDVERLRHRVLAQARALTASRSREMERDAKVADLTRATLRQQALLEGFLQQLVSQGLQQTPDTAASNGFAISRVPSTSVSLTAATHVPALGVSVPASTVHVADATLKDPSTFARETPSKEVLTVQATSPLLASPGAGDPGLLVRSGIEVTTVAGSSAAPCEAAHSTALLEARTVKVHDREARRAVSAMVSELRDQISRLAKPRSSSPPNADRNPRIFEPLEAPSDHAWHPLDEDSRQYTVSPLALNSSVPNLSHVVQSLAPPTSPHETVVNSGRRLRSRRSATRKHTSVAVKSHADNPSHGVEFTHDPVSGSVSGLAKGRSRSLRHDTAGRFPKPVTDDDITIQVTPTEPSSQHQQLSFVDAFGQTITLMARCDIMPATSNTVVKIPSQDTSDERGRKERVPAAADEGDPLMPALYSSSRHDSSFLSQREMSSADRAINLDRLIRQHKAAFDSLLLTRTPGDPVGGVVVTPSVRLRHLGLQSHSASPSTSSRKYQGKHTPPGLRIGDLGVPTSVVQ